MPRHPVFARVYAALAALGERGSVARLRAATLAGTHGRLLVIGLGPGHDLAHLPAAVTEVVAVEPEPSMRRLSRRRIVAAGRPVHLLAAVGERLPLQAGTVDAVLLAFVLCSVEQPRLVLAEVDRVLRTGGSVHVLEHVRAAEGSRRAGWQDRVAPLWRRCAGGCRPNRRTQAELERAGFDTSGLADKQAPLVPIVSPYLHGAAARRMHA
jgi:ubiquinone/menaquinone biosynthesis C-methylase UbiE